MGPLTRCGPPTEPPSKLLRSAAAAPLPAGKLDRRSGMREPQRTPDPREEAVSPLSATVERRMRGGSRSTVTDRPDAPVAATVHPPLDQTGPSAPCDTDLKDRAYRGPVADLSDGSTERPASADT